jgi:hypothetical protein
LNCVNSDGKSGRMRNIETQNPKPYTGNDHRIRFTGHPQIDTPPQLPQDAEPRLVCKKQVDRWILILLFGERKESEPRRTERYDNLKGESVLNSRHPAHNVLPAEI